MMKLLKANEPRKLYSDISFQKFDNLAIAAGLLVPPSNQKGGRKPLVRPKSHRILLRENIIKNITKSSNCMLSIAKPGRPYIPPKNGVVCQRALRAIKCIFGSNELERSQNIFTFDKLHQKDQKKVFTMINDEISSKKSETVSNKPRKKTKKVSNSKRKRKEETTLQSKSKDKKVPPLEKTAQPKKNKKTNPEITTKETVKLKEPKEVYHNPNRLFVNPNFVGENGLNIVKIHEMTRTPKVWEEIQKNIEKDVLSHLKLGIFQKDAIPFSFSDDNDNTLGSKNRKFMFGGMIKYFETHCKDKKEIADAKNHGRDFLFFLLDNMIQIYIPEEQKGFLLYNDEESAPQNVEFSEDIELYEKELKDMGIVDIPMTNVQGTKKVEKTPPKVKNDDDMFNMSDEEGEKNPVTITTEEKTSFRCILQHEKLVYSSWKYKSEEEKNKHQNLLKLLWLDGLELKNKNPENYKKIGKFVEKSGLRKIQTFQDIYFHSSQNECKKWSDPVLDMFVFLVDRIFRPRNAIIASPLMVVANYTINDDDISINIS